MKNIYIIQLFCAFSWLFCACTHDLKRIDGLDQEKWKNDINGCLGYRKSIISVLDEISSLTTGLNEEQVVALFGKPNKTELYERGQKFFIFYLSCTDDETVQTFKLRFNATGMVNETLILRD